MTGNNRKIAQVVLAVLVSLIGLALTGVLYLWVWMLMALHTLHVFTEYEIVPNPYFPVALPLALTVPFFLLNWWWSSMAYGMFGVPMTDLKGWLAEPADTLPQQ